MPDTLDSRYITVQYNTFLHTAQQLRRQNFGHTSNSRKTPIHVPHPHGQVMGVFRELFGEKWPRDIGSALYCNCTLVFIALHCSTHHLSPWYPTVNTSFSTKLSTGPDSKVHGANMGPTWVLSVPDGPHAGPMNFAIRAPSQDSTSRTTNFITKQQNFTVEVVYPP